MATAVLTIKQKTINPKNKTHQINIEPESTELVGASGLLDLFYHQSMEQKQKLKLNKNIDSCNVSSEQVGSSGMSAMSASTTTTPTAEEIVSLKDTNSSETTSITGSLDNNEQENKNGNEGQPKLSDTKAGYGKLSSMQISFESKFLKRYWRNDRKNIQCFPICPEFGDYYICRVNGYEHRPRKGACREPIALKVEYKTNQYDLKKLTVLGRFVVCTANAEAMTSTDHSIDPNHRHELFPNESIKTLCANHGKLNRTELTKLTKLCYQAKHNMESTMNMKRETDGIVQASYRFIAESWRIEVPLSKRRHSPNKPSMVQKYCFEVLIFDEVENPLDDPSREGKYELIARRQSQFFEIANTRTLVRKLSQLQKADGINAKKMKTAEPFRAHKADTELPNMNRTGVAQSPSIDAMMHYQGQMNQQIMQQPYLHMLASSNVQSPLMHGQQQAIWNPHQFGQIQLAQSIQHPHFMQQPLTHTKTEHDKTTVDNGELSKTNEQSRKDAPVNHQHQALLQQSLMSYQMLMQQQMQQQQMQSQQMQPQQMQQQQSQPMMMSNPNLQSRSDAPLQHYFPQQLTYNPPVFLPDQMRQLQQLQQLQQKNEEKRKET